MYIYIYGISPFYYRNMTTCSTDHPNAVEHLYSMNVMMLSILWFASFVGPRALITDMCLTSTVISIGATPTDFK